MTSRTELYLEINRRLLGTYKPAGIPKWWDRKRHLLDGKCPMDWLFDAKTQEQLDRLWSLVIDIDNGGGT